MADLNKELNEYLLKSKNDEQCKISMEADSSQDFIKLHGITHTNSVKQTWYNRLGEEYFCSMTSKQRIAAFALCCFSGFLCLLLSACYLPVLLIHQRKFVGLYTLGSILLLLSLCFLWGPRNYIQSLLAPKRRYYALFYIAMLITTLYCTICLKSLVLTSLCCLLESIALVSFLISSMPGGTASLSLASKLCSRMCKSSIGSTLSI
ncbi:PREDICTED: vesicle transport protein SFT2C [Polistes dominula]|uniref:Vesicle transport protein n=1 Tax=Polistes dominula TaxID=743375 RepID=A0ABM1IN22_POLDO|nr:PREDICTED: vesicle transport protein SFT2C [Polistes dominula]